MNGKRIVATALVLVVMSGPGFARAVAAQPVAAAPPQPADVAGPGASGGATPPRVSYLNGAVSFWRQGASDWAPAQLNTPLALGDLLYTGQDGTVEIQVGRAAFVRAGNDTQIGLDNQEPDFLQFRVTAGHAGVDLRQLPPGATLEVDTPQAAFSIAQAGYYRLDVDQETIAFSTHRGGAAMMALPGGAPALVATGQQVVLTGAESPHVALGPAAPLNAWDAWNSQRSAYLLRPASQQYVSAAMYGAEELDRYGTWLATQNYGPVWVPSGVPAGWQPYSTGRWIWDPRFGWTWLDDAPWGWAPYHHGRWVFLGGYWAWAPGPIVMRPVYAPALVVFLGGAGVSVGVRPVFWAPLGWGEPVVPWWGRPGFVGVPWWGGWGGPRVVNNVVVSRTTVVNVTSMTVYRNVNATHAVVGVSAEQFGRGHAKVTRISVAEVQRLRPVHGALDIRPVSASVMPATGPAVRPPADLHGRPVVATRPPKDLAPTLREHGLSEGAGGRPPVRLVPLPGREGPSGRAGVGKGPVAPPTTGVPPLRGPERGSGSAGMAPPRAGAVKRPAPGKPGAEDAPGGGPERPVKPLPADKPVPPQKQGPGEQRGKPAHGEAPDRGKER
jgi:hypothetical protein